MIKKSLLIMIALCMMICVGLFTPTQSNSIYATVQTTPQVDGGSSHSITLKDGGTVWVWGDNSYGQLGDGTNINTNTPKKLENISNVIAISAGSFHNLALKMDGTVWAWGQNNGYQLGDGTSTNRNIPVQVSGIGNVKAIAAGNAHSLALKEDGTVWAWGMNNSGQLGDGTTISRSTPVVVPGLTNVTAIAVSENFSFALKSDETLWGWGDNSYGQLGVGTFVNSYTPTAVSISRVKAMAVGARAAYAIGNDGALYVWGDNYYGELGLGQSSPGFTTTPTYNPSMTNIVAVAAGGLFAVAKKEDGTIWAWGYNYFGQVGDGTNIDKKSPTQISGLANVSSISCGWAHTLVTKIDGSIYVWGNNDQGQLGDGTNIRKNQPIQVPNFYTSIVYPIVGDNKVLLKWSSVLGATCYNVKRSQTAGGPYTTIASGITATTYNDTAVTNGTTYYYLVTAVTLTGEKTIFDEVSATPINVPQITGGYSHTIARMTDNSVWVWGDNTYGQLGDNTKLDINICERLENISNVKVISAGINYNIALKVDGTLWAWGLNNYGQLGDGTTIDRCGPVQVVNINNVKKIATGGCFSAVLKTDGTVWTWGDNQFGQLGDGTTTGRIIPGQVLGLTNIISIAAGDDFIFALKDDGTLWTWGRNDDRVICDSTSSYVSTPIKISSISNVQDVACGWDAVYAIKQDGTLWAWGAGSYGQIGNGTYANFVYSPVQVSGLQNVMAVSTGLHFAVALLSDGTIKAWGNNNWGQIGDGTTVGKNIPTQVYGLDNILVIGCGGFHSLAYKSDGSVFAWGLNKDGQLGDGTGDGNYKYSSTPVKVPNVGLISMPAAPQNLTAIVGNAKVILNWMAANGAASYNIKRAQTSGGPYTTIDSNVTTTSFTDTSVTNDTTYYYIVTSVNRDGESGGCNEVSAIPNTIKPLAPTNVTTETGCSKVTLRWDPVEGAWTYNVKRSDFSGGPYTTITTNLTGTTFTDTGLTNGKWYYYLVTAVNDNGEASSSEVSAIPVVPPPSNLTATAGKDKVSLSWTRGSGVFYWSRVKRATTPGGPYVGLFYTTGSTFNDTDITVGTTYYYIIVSSINDEESTPTNEASATPYSAPSYLQATAGNALVTLTWEAATDSTYCSVKRSTTAGGPYTTLAINVTGTTYNDTTALNYTTYYYVVTTISVGAERFSNEASATPWSVDSYEPNESMSTAKSISKNTTITPTLHDSWDVDYFKFTISYTSNCTITLTPPSGNDYNLYLLNSSGSQIGSSTNGTGAIDTITKSSLASGTYYIKVIGYHGSYSRTMTYTLKTSSY